MTLEYCELQEKLFEEQKRIKTKKIPFVVCYGVVTGLIVIIYLAILPIYNALVTNYIENHDSVYYDYIITPPYDHSIKKTTSVSGYIIACVIPISVFAIIVCVGYLCYHCWYDKRENISKSKKTIVLISSILFLLCFISIIGAIALDIFYFNFEMVKNVWMFSLVNITANIFVIIGFSVIFFITIVGMILWVSGNLFSG